LTLAKSKSKVEDEVSWLKEEAKRVFLSSPESELKSNSPRAIRFAREMRQSRKNCPLCSVVQKELDKGHDLPVEEWIYLSHLSTAHQIIP
jgi:hypothetical protein